MNRPAYTAHVRLLEADGRVVYEGEAIYRPQKPHPLGGENVPQIGVPDAVMPERPRDDEGYRLSIGDEGLEVVAVYLERIASCWWFVLGHPLSRPPRA